MKSEKKPLIKPVKAPAKAPSKTSRPRAAAAKPKAPAKKQPVAIPPVLLEDDAPSVPAASGPGHRYALGPTTPPAHFGPPDDMGELPEAYGTQALLLTARDPHWLYAHWDLTRAQLKEYNSLSADRHLVLRVYLNQVAGKPSTEVHVHPESRNWFIHVGRAGAKFIAELGYYTRKKQWITIATSGVTLTPTDSLSDDSSVRFATLPEDVTIEQLQQLVQTAAQDNAPLLEVIQQLQGTAGADRRTKATKAFGASGASARWTPGQERALAGAISMDEVRRVWIGSLEITELIRRQLAKEISSQAAARFSLPTSPVGGVSSLASPFGGGGAERAKGFWFNVNAELVIYGATEPDAEVTIGGRVIKLRPDGSFSYRFALPDGQYELPAVAVSADKTDGRAAELKFSRGTEYRGDVGVHPQDPLLKPPLAANVA